MHKIAHYLQSSSRFTFQGASEYVVILDEGEESTDYEREGFELDSVTEIDADLSSLPCSRPLIAAQ